MADEQGRDKPERLTNANPVPVTTQKLRTAAAEAELRGDWVEAELLVSAADRIMRLEAQNQAYRHALEHGVSINFINKRRWFNIGRD